MDDFSGTRFLEGLASGVAAGVIAGLVVASLVYRFIEARLHLRQRDETATAVLQMIATELEWNHEMVEDFRNELTAEQMPYPGMSADGWVYLTQPGVMTALRTETVTALLTTYARLRTIADLYGVLWNLKQGPTRSLSQVVAVSHGTEESAAAFAEYWSHTELIRERLLDRIDEVEPWLDDARAKVTAEVASRGRRRRGVISRAA